MSVERVCDRIGYVVLFGFAVGKLVRDDLGHWYCEWRSGRGWEALSVLEERVEARDAEEWAIGEIAGIVALEEQGRRW
jgi:hypothetical protein